jgi:N-glycosylase/DNA lyase
MLTKFVADYSLEKVVAIEESDRQFLALKSAWEKVKNYNHDGANDEQVETVFLVSVIYNALISYQIA